MPCRSLDLAPHVQMCLRLCLGAAYHKVNEWTVTEAPPGTPPPKPLDRGVPVVPRSATASCNGCADVKVVLADGSSLPASRSALAAHTTYFEGKLGPPSPHCRAGPRRHELRLADGDDPGPARDVIRWCHGEPVPAVARLHGARDRRQLKRAIRRLVRVYHAARRYAVAGLQRLIRAELDWTDGNREWQALLWRTDLLETVVRPALDDLPLDDPLRQLLLRHVIVHVFVGIVLGRDEVDPDTTKTAVSLHLDLDFMKKMTMHLLADWSVDAIYHLVHVLVHGAEIPWIRWLAR